MQIGVLFTPKVATYKISFPLYNGSVKCCVFYETYCIVPERWSVITAKLSVKLNFKPLTFAISVNLNSRYWQYLKLKKCNKNGYFSIENVKMLCESEMSLVPRSITNLHNYKMMPNLPALALPEPNKILWKQMQIYFNIGT